MAEGVVFAMLGSYRLARRLVPTLVMYLLRGHEADSHRPPTTIFGRLQARFEHWFGGLRESYRSALEAIMEHRRAFVAGFLGFCLLSGGLTFLLGRDFFPNVDSGQFRLHVRGRAGLRVEETARLVDLVEQENRREVPKTENNTVVDNIGPPYNGKNHFYTKGGTIGPSDNEVLVYLKPRHRPTL